ncbi:MAG: helix-turn-helix domain-containing protein [Bryobacteraceae bacterium]
MRERGRDHSPDGKDSSRNRAGARKQSGRLTGEQLRFLRKHLGLSGEQLGRYLQTDRTKISKWERGEDRIGPATDRLVRLLAAALDSGLRPGVSAIAEHLPEISDDSGKVWELHVDVATLQTTFLSVPRAA